MYYFELERFCVIIFITDSVLHLFKNIYMCIHLVIFPFYEQNKVLLRSGYIFMAKRHLPISSSYIGLSDVIIVILPSLLGTLHCVSAATIFF